MTHLGSFPGPPPTHLHPHHGSQGSQNPTGLGRQLPGSRLPQGDGGADGCPQPTMHQARGFLPSTPCPTGHWEGRHCGEGPAAHPLVQTGMWPWSPQRSPLWPWRPPLLGSAIRAETLPPFPSQSKQAAKLLWKWYCTAGSVPSASPQPRAGGSATGSPRPLEGGASHGLTWITGAAACSPLCP